MDKIRDLLSGHLHVEQIAFTQGVGLDSDEPQTHCYLGATSTGRFLLMSLSSPTDADHPIELGERTWIYARSAEMDFVKWSDLPIIAARPRSQREPELEKVFDIMQATLAGCLQLGLGLVKPGSIRWDGDQFSAEYVVPEGGRCGVKFTTPDGRDVPESFKAMVLADLEAEPKDRKLKATFVKKEHTTLMGTEAEAARRASAPVPGSIEAKIEALFAAREKERLRKGIRGKLVRDEQGRATEIILESEPSCRVQFDYDERAHLPPPFPSRARTFLEHAEARPGVPNSEIIIYSARISDRPLDESAFDPSLRLKPGSFVRGILRPDRSTFIPDAADRAFINELARQRHFQRRGRRDLGDSGPGA